jgi:hypothetical protein
MSATKTVSASTLSTGSKRIPFTVSFVQTYKYGELFSAENVLKSEISFTLQNFAAMIKVLIFKEHRKKKNKNFLPSLDAFVLQVPDTMYDGSAVSEALKTKN